MQTNKSHPKPAMEALAHYHELPAEEMKARARAHYEQQKRRRTVRDFDSRPVPREVIEHCLLAAGTAPSGANQQPWHFAVISDPALKRQIREAAEEEERAFYSGRAPEEWLRALAPLGTDPNKPFLEEAPLLIAIFAQKYGIDAQGERFSHYYVPESVGIATGFLITALHDAGLATLTHTPSPMGFLNSLCGRPENEKPVILLVVGYPKPGCLVPVHGGLKKPLAQISTWL
ncbi:nitroreductase family protein [Pelomonas sp. APW6]|uniref:Nitroreductase family protein n=1 Tax=Roseateles subflavus TaxID=3053353 RepID=A0ABT7LCV6_9BURK|nr:nitroreductase family protein [Pelomonas sp. APW6]MDL5030695.1 nitroreductase family protein [Pelomonas sp. APW6]